MHRRILSLFCAATLVATAASASPIGYATATDQNLYSINFGTGAATLIGSTGLAGSMEGLALSPTGILYGTDTSGSLYLVSTSTGAASLIGTTAIGNLEGLDFNGNDLVATNFGINTNFYGLNTSTGAPGYFRSTGAGFTRAMAIKDGSTALILSDTPAFQTLVSVDLTTGAFTNLNATPITSNIYGMDFASDGTLYGVGEGLFTIDPLTGTAKSLGSAGNEVYLSLAMAPSRDTAPVPEPASLSLLGTGLAFAGIRRYRRAN